LGKNKTGFDKNNIKYFQALHSSIFHLLDTV
jgi:hypothetical protein